MSKRKKYGIIVGAVAGVLILWSMKSRGGPKAVEVRLEEVSTRDLVAAVTASGKIEADAQVDISADITGRITRLGVREGDLVKQGQFLVQIDPSQYRSSVKRAEGLLASNKAALIQAQTNRDQLKRELDRVIELRKADSIVSQEMVERAQQQYDVAVASYAAASANVEQAEGALQEAKTQLEKTTIVSPINGRVVRLPVEVGEVAVPGTFSRETGRLMTIADLGTVIAKVKVDETDVVRIDHGDSVSIKIDAFPDSNFSGRVTRIGNASATGAASTGGSGQAVDFDVEITLDRPPVGIRPDLSANARIITDTRKSVLAIPIVALAVRELEDLPNENRPAAGTDQRPKDREGVFIVQNGIATFHPVVRGITGDEYFEVVSGLKAGDSIVAGPYQAVRDMRDSARVKASPNRGGGRETLAKGMNGGGGDKGGK